MHSNHLFGHERGVGVREGIGFGFGFGVRLDRI
jgi:hypothetical protein